MRFSTSAFLAVASAPLLVLAQGGESNGSNPFNIPTTSLNTEAGETVNLTWKPTTEGTVTIYLRSGPSNDLKEGTAIASNIDNNGAFTWKVPSDIVRGSNYALEIVDDADDTNTNYTPPFVIESTNNAAPSASSSMASSSMASSTASDSSSTTDSMSSMSMSMTMTDSSMMTSSTAGAMASSASSHMSGNSTASMTTSSSTRGSTASASGGSDVQNVEESEGGAGRVSSATTFAGLLGLVAVGALAL